MIKLGNDTEVAFAFSETPDGKPLCRVRVRSGSQNTTLEPNQAQLVDVLRVMAKHMGVKMRSFAADQAPAPTCDHEPIDLASVSLADIAAAKRAKLLAPLEEQAARVREEIERLEAMAGGDAEAEVAEPRLKIKQAKATGYDLTRAAVLDYLRSQDKAKRPAQVATAVGYGEGVVFEVLTELAEAGDIESLGRGFWRAA